MKSDIIILDSVDKCGKDSIKDLLIKETNGQVLIFIRGFISQIVYSRIYKRNIDEQFFINKMRDFANVGVKFIVLTARPEVLEKRFDLHNETDLPKADILKHLSVFHQVVFELRNLNFNIEIVDTSDVSILDNVNEIKRIINF